jgi:hypothetical protein
MAEVVISHGEVPANHLRSFGHIMGYEAPILLSAEEIEAELPEIWAPFDSQRYQAGYDDGIKAAIKYDKTKSAELAKFLSDKGFNASKDDLQLLVRKELVVGNERFMQYEGIVNGQHFGRSDRIQYLQPSGHIDHRQLLGVTYDLGVNAGVFALPNGSIPKGRYWSYIDLPNQTRFPYAYNYEAIRSQPRTTITFGRAVIARTTVVEEVRPVPEGGIPKLVGATATYQIAEYIPDLTPEQQARLEDIKQRSTQASDELYEQDPSFFELLVDDALHSFDYERDNLYREIG